MSKPPDFQPSEVVETYRKVIAERDSATTKGKRAELDRTAVRLRKFWQEWQGEDSLHKTAFGDRLPPTAD